MSVSDVLPSPPHTSHRERKAFPRLHRPPASTPDDSPSLLAPSSSNGTSNRKRVEFSPWTDILEDANTRRSLTTNEMKTIPKSRDSQTVTKSILKYKPNAADPAGATDVNELEQPVSMDSLVLALGNNDKFTSLDAYSTLGQLVKTYEDIPEDTDTRSNVAIIQKCIRRDVAANNFKTPLDTNLGIQALKVAVILIWSDHFSTLVTEDFKTFITDRAITTLAEHNVPKIVIAHYIHLLAVQNFRTILFTSGTRTHKLLEALKELPHHVQGKGIMSERLLVYQKLIEQAKPIMKAKAGLWIGELLTGMSASVKEIRDRAVSVASKTCAAFPALPAISQAARDALYEKINDRTLGSVLIERLDKMITVKDDAPQVPQIWALVMLLCNSPETAIDSWSRTREWLRVIQKCFNCSDVNVRTQALPAWNRFIYIARPHDASDTLMSMLAKPIAAQIERTSSSHASKGLRPAAISSYCMLLYYAFRPAASHKQYTRVWNEYIVKVATTNFLSKSTANSDMCCRILMSLFWKDTSASRVWNEHRAHENNAMQPEELPALDCKWIRSKAGPILHIFQLLFTYSAWGPTIQHSDQAFIATAWRHFLRALREASSKEIKPSTETRSALKSIFLFLDQNVEPQSLGVVEDDSHNTSAAQRRMACCIAHTELGTSSILNMLEIVEIGDRSRYLLGELAAEIQKANTAPFGAPQTHLGNEEVSPAFRRILALINDQLEHDYTVAHQQSHAFLQILEVVVRIIGQSQMCSAVTCLQILEHGLAKVISDESGLYASFSENSHIAQMFSTLLSVLAGKLVAISIDHLASLDTLIASVLLTTNDLEQEGALDLRRKLLQNKEQIRHGFDNTRAIFTSSSSIGSNSDEDGHCSNSLNIVLDDAASEFDTPMLADTDTSTPQPTVLDATFSDPTTPHSSNNVKLVSGRKQPGSKLAMEQSVHRGLEDGAFAAELLPTSPDITEPRLLTAEQTEGACRPRSKQTVDFADLRSSPSRRMSRSSRAPSTDCEMARKLVASDNLPSTPILLRQSDVNDDADIPSPTPRGRQYMLQVTELDVPNSPSSVNGSIPADLVIHDLAASPSKIGQFEDTAINFLDSTPAEVRENTGGPDYFSSVHPRGLPQDQGYSSSVSPGGPLINRSHVPVSRSSTTEDRQSTLRRLSPLNDAHPTIVALHADSKVHALGSGHEGSDDGGDLSASQLSQDLDWHIRDKVQSSPHVEGNVPQDSQPLRKRKRRATSSDAVQTNSQVKRRSSRRQSAMTILPSSPPVTLPAAKVSLYELQQDCVPNQALDKSVTVTRKSKRNKTSRVQQQEANLVRNSSYMTAPEQRSTEEGDVTHPRNAHGLPQISNALTAPTNNDESIEEQRDIDLGPVVMATTFPQDSRGDVPSDPASTTAKSNVMGILTAALNVLQHHGEANADEAVVTTTDTLDLRAIDELCFKIRYHAQEIVQGRRQSK